MEVSRNVIVDLLPLYNSGEASPDTAALVEDYLRRDPSLRRLAEAPEAEAQPAPRTDAERIAVERTRRLLRRRQWTMAAALLCTLLPFSFGDLEGFSFVMFRDVPASRLLWVAGAALWLVYAQLRRSTRTTGL
jgi:hypothetical protein